MKTVVAQEECFTCFPVFEKLKLTRKHPMEKRDLSCYEGGYTTHGGLYDLLGLF